MATPNYNLRQGGPVTTVGVTGGMVEDRFVKNIDQKVEWDHADIAQFTTFLRAIKGRMKTTKRTKFHMRKRSGIPMKLTTSGATADTTTELIRITDNVAAIRAKDILLNIVTREQYKVKTTPVATGGEVDVAVTRGHGTSTAANIGAGVSILRLANSQGQWNGAGPLIGTDPEMDYNYVQEVRTPFGASDVCQKIANSGGIIGPSEMKWVQEDSYRDHLRTLNNSVLFGVRDEDGTAHTTAGLEYWLRNGGDAHYHDTTGVTLTEAAFDDYLYDLWYYSKKDKLCLCGEQLIALVKGWAKTYLKINMELKKYGLNVWNYQSRQGLTIQMMLEPSLVDAGLDDVAWFIEPECTALVGYANTMYSVLYKGDTGNGLQARDVTGKIYEFRTDLGLEFTKGFHCGQMVGISA